MVSALQNCTPYGPLVFSFSFKQLQITKYASTDFKRATVFLGLELPIDWKFILHMKAQKFWVKRIIVRKDHICLPNFDKKDENGKKTLSKLQTAFCLLLFCMAEFNYWHVC